MEDQLQILHVKTTPEVKARWLFLFNVLALVITIITISILWPDWADSDIQPIPDSFAMVLFYIVVGAFLLLSAFRKEIKEQFPIGYSPQRRMR